MPQAFALIIAYLLGSIPVGLLLTKAAGLGDVRAIGSGNIGATNVLRTGNKKLAAATLLLDMVKGAAAAAIGNIFSPQSALLCGIAAMIGHVFPVWLRFKGGKGVATGFGALLALNPLTGIAAFAVWLAVFAVSRISSLSAIAAAGSAVPLALVISGPGLAFYALATFVLILFTHRTNIARLLDGSEPRFGRKA